MECSNEDYLIQLITSIIIAGLSLIFSLVVIIIILKKNLQKNYSFQILLYISINDFFRSFLGLTMFQVQENILLCSILAYLDIYFLLSNMLWASCLTFTIYQIIVIEETSFEKHQKFWVFISFIFSGILEALPFSTQSYGNSNKICQIKEDKTGEIWRFSLIFLPNLALLVFVLVLFWKIMKKIELIGDESAKSLVFDRGLVYVMIVAVVVIPFFVVRIAQIFENTCLLHTLVIYMNISLNIQGILNGIVFFCNKTVQSILFSRFNRLNYSVQSENVSLRISFASDISISN